MLTSYALSMFLISRQAKNLSPQTIRWYKGILLKFAEKYPVLPRCPIEIELFIASCTAGDERQHGYYRALRAFYQWLEKRNHINPVIKNVEAPRRINKSPRSLTPEQLYQLLIYPHRKEIKAALLFLADTGCRVGELSSLDKSKLIETPDGYIARVQGKTGQRLVPISNEVYYSLSRVLPFTWSSYRLRRLISKAFKDAGIPGTAHTLRHTFGTLWNGDELILQSIMGHASINTTRIYRHLRTQRLSEQHHKYSPLLAISGIAVRLDDF